MAKNDLIAQEFEKAKDTIAMSDDLRDYEEFFVAGFNAGEVAQAQAVIELAAALTKATHVIETTTALFHPNYMVHTDALLKECQAALKRAAGES